MVDSSSLVEISFVSHDSVSGIMSVHVDNLCFQSEVV